MELTKLFHAVGNLRLSHSPVNLEEMCNAINEFGCGDGTCVDFLYTENTDKLPFGVMVTPLLTNEDVTAILIGEDEVKIQKFYVELDSKVFQYNLTDEEIVSVILNNIIMMLDPNAIVRLRGAIDLYFVKIDSTLNLKNSIQYQQILTLGLIDTLVQFTNCLYRDSTSLDSLCMEQLGLSEDFKSALVKLFNNIEGFTNNNQQLIILDWCFRLYNDVEHERIPAIRQLERAKDITGSTLYKRLIDKVIDSMYKIDTDSLIRESYEEVFSINEAKKNSIFSQIKYNGLRSIEDDFYEFIVRARNAETEEEVMYALKQINVRLSILDDYIKKEELTDDERKRWVDIYNKYRAIRDEIAHKKIYNKKNYGVFFDYNQLDNMYDE